MKFKGVRSWTATASPLKNPSYHGMTSHRDSQQAKRFWKLHGNYSCTTIIYKVRNFIEQADHTRCMFSGGKLWWLIGKLSQYLYISRRSYCFLQRQRKKTSTTELVCIKILTHFKTERRCSIASRRLKLRIIHNFRKLTRGQDILCSENCMPRT